MQVASSMDGTGRRLGTSGRLKPQETKESLVHKLTEVVRNEVLRAFEESPRSFPSSFISAGHGNLSNSPTTSRGTCTVNFYDDVLALAGCELGCARLYIEDWARRSVLHLFFYSEALAAEGFKRGMSLQKKSRSGALSYSDMITVSTHNT